MKPDSNQYSRKGATIKMLVAGMGIAALLILSEPTCSATLVHYYSFDGPASGLTDQVGSANGTFINTPGTWVADNPPKNSGALSYTATGPDGVRAAASLSLTEGTFSGWYRPNAIDNAWGFLDLLTTDVKATGASVPMRIETRNNASTHEISVFDIPQVGGSTLAINGSGGDANLFNIDNNSWHLLTLTWLSGDAVKLYVDGTLRASQTYSASGATDTGTWYYGGPRDDSGRRGYVNLGSQAVFNTALSGAEVALQFQDGLLGVPEPSTIILLVLGLGCCYRAHRTRQERPRTNQ